MATHSKAYRESLAKVDRFRDYQPAEAISLLASLPSKKFVESVEVPVLAGVDQKARRLWTALQGVVAENQAVLADVRGAGLLAMGLGSSLLVLTLLRDAAARTRAPVALVYGERDAIAWPETVTRFAALRAQPALRDVPAVFLTAAHDRDLLVRAFEAGAVDYVTKPFMPEELLARVGAHIGLKQTRDRLERYAAAIDERTALVATSHVFFTSGYIQPVAEIASDGSSVITKHAGTGGLVSVDTITAQLVYEIQSTAYLGPDVTTHLDTVQLAPDGPDRVAGFSPMVNSAAAISSAWSTPQTWSALMVTGEMVRMVIAGAAEISTVAGFKIAPSGRAS